MSFIQKYGKYFLILIFLYAGVQFFLIFFLGNSSYNINADNWVKTEAVIIDLETDWNYSLEEYTTYPTVEFKTENGETYQVKLASDVERFLNTVGSTLTIKYDKNNPYLAELASTSIFAYVLGVLVLLLVIIWIIPPFRKWALDLLQKLAFGK